MERGFNICIFRTAVCPDLILDDQGKAENLLLDYMFGKDRWKIKINFYVTIIFTQSYADIENSEFSERLFFSIQLNPSLYSF